MDEVELIFLASDYLKELGYEINKDNFVVKDKIVSLKEVKMESNKNDSRKSISVDDIDVFIDDNIIFIIDTSSNYLFFNRRDFSRDKYSRLTEKIVSTTYSFTKVNDRVIKTCNQKLTKLFNGKVENQINNSYMDSIEVDQDYELTDGYPSKRKDKKLIKE